MNKIRLAGMATLAVLGGIAVGGCGTAPTAATQSAAHSSSAGDAAAAVKGTAGRNLPCFPADIAAVAVVRPGTAPATLDRLGARPLARVASTQGQELAFFHATSPTGAPALTSTLAARRAASAALATNPAMVPADASLQSCDYLLRDRPAAQPYITAAINAAVASHIAPSASAVRTRLNIVQIGDNPLQHGSLVIVLLLEGKATPTGPQGHLVYGPYTSVFVALNRTTKQVTGTASGTW
jgi:hypothetical protein